MVEEQKTPREQIVVQHVPDQDGDWLVEVGVKTPRVWQSTVEQMTLSLYSVTAFVGRSLDGSTCCGHGQNGVDEDGSLSLSLTGVSTRSEAEPVAYGIDVSEDDAECLIAQRVDRDIGVDLISRSDGAFQQKRHHLHLLSLS